MAKVLVVDDDHEISTVLSECLTACGHQVRLAADPAHMAVITRDFAPDLVILDMQMPGGGGPSAQRVIEGNERLRNSKMILHSSMPMEHLKRWFPEAPNRRYLTKGGPLSEFKKLVEEFLRS